MRQGGIAGLGKAEMPRASHNIKSRHATDQPWCGVLDCHLSRYHNPHPLSSCAFCYPICINRAMRIQFAALIFSRLFDKGRAMARKKHVVVVNDHPEFLALLSEFLD